MSADVESRGLIHLGDKTTTGGVVVQGIGNVALVGSGVTQVGMLATCPACKVGQGKIVPLTAINVFADSVQAALHGDIVACGCPYGANTVIASAGSMSFRVKDGIVTGNKPFSSPEEASAAYNDVAAMAGAHFESNNTKSESTNCTHNDGALLVAEYIISEIKKNIESSVVKRIQYLLDHDGSREKEWRNLSSFEKASTPYPEPDIISALAVWTERVYRGRPWDHKPLIMNNPLLKSQAVHRKVRTLSEVRKQRLFTNEEVVNSESYWHKYKQYDYYLDVWSNIHYGYVGLESGFTKDLLLKGADAAQFLDQLSISGDAPDDRTCVEIGFSLFEDYKDNIDKLTPYVILEHLNAANLNESREIHICFNKFKEEIKNSDF
ncbi:TPA: polymorphic toxin type 44 domain-containing protein [Photobacterium damselae]